jgi:hypothetical protein
MKWFKKPKLFLVVAIQEIVYSTAEGNELQLITKMPIVHIEKWGFFRVFFFSNFAALKTVITNYLDEGSNTRPLLEFWDVLSLSISVGSYQVCEFEVRDFRRVWDGLQFGFGRQTWIRKGLKFSFSRFKPRFGPFLAEQVWSLGFWWMDKLGFELGSSKFEAVWSSLYFVSIQHYLNSLKQGVVHIS